MRLYENGILIIKWAVLIAVLALVLPLIVAAEGIGGYADR